MSASDLHNRILEDGAHGALLNWREMREQIHDEFERATTQEDRVILLNLFKVVMDTAEITVAEDDREMFRKTRQQDYNSLLIRECLIGENVSVEFMDAVTKREVLAERMPHDAELRKLAVKGMAEPHLTIMELHELAVAKTRPSPPKTGWRRLFSKG